MSQLEELYFGSVHYPEAARAYLQHSESRQEREGRPPNTLTHRQRFQLAQTLQRRDFKTRFRNSRYFPPSFQEFKAAELRLRRSTSLESVKLASQACLDNSANLLVAARILADQRYFGYAASLAATAHEESGKACLLEMAGAEVVPITTLAYFGLLRTVQARRPQGRDIHRLKADLSSSLTRTHAFEGEPWGTSIALGVQTSLLGWLRKRNDPELKQYLANPGDKDLRNMAILALSDAIRADPPWIISQEALMAEQARLTDLGHLARIRNRGKYVDVIESRVHSPTDISEAEFKTVLGAASHAVELARIYVEGRHKPDPLLALIPYLVSAAGPLQLPVLTGGVLEVSWNSSTQPPPE